MCRTFSGAAPPVSCTQSPSCPSSWHVRFAHRNLAPLLAVARAARWMRTAGLRCHPRICCAGPPPFPGGVAPMRAPPVPRTFFLCPMSKLKVSSETTLEVCPPAFLRVRTNSSKRWLLHLCSLLITHSFRDRRSISCSYDNLGPPLKKRSPASSLQRPFCTRAASQQAQSVVLTLRADACMGPAQLALFFFAPCMYVVLLVSTISFGFHIFLFISKSQPTLRLDNEEPIHHPSVREGERGRGRRRGGVRARV